MSGTIPVIMFLLIATGGALAADSRVDDALFLAARKALPQAMMPTCSQRVALLLQSDISSCGDKKGGRTSITLNIRRWFLLPQALSDRSSIWSKVLGHSTS